MALGGKGAMPVYRDPWEDIWLGSGTGTLTRPALMKILRGARQSGSLGLSNMDIKKRLPHEVCHLHDKQNRGETEAFWDNVDLKFLDVAMNNLEELPREIDKLDHLERLIARRNQIRTLPVQLTNLGTTLVYLDFKSNAVEYLPVEIGRLYNLVEFDLEDNRLVRLPDTIGDLQSLALLNVSKNQLIEFPETLGKLGKLEVLDCQSNSLKTFPRSVGGLKKLLMLIAHHNKILELPYEIEGMVKLIMFDLSENLIVDMPATLPASPKLTRCLLNFNRIPSPFDCLRAGSKSFQVLSQCLQELDIQQNKLTDIPVELGAMRALTNLNVGHNYLEDIPHELGYLPVCKVLELGGNPIKTIRRRILEGPLAEILAELRRRGPPHELLGDVSDLFAEENPMDEKALCPDEGEMKVMYRNAIGNGKLYLQQFFLDNVPEAIYEPGSMLAESLIKLDLSANFLTELPAALGTSCSALRYLACGHNTIEKFPSTLLQLPLVILKIDNNKLLNSAFDDIEAAGVVGSPLALNLRELYAEVNGLLKMPSCIFDFEVLEKLCLTKNYIKYLEPGQPWNQLKKVHLIDLSENKLVSLGELPVMVANRELPALRILNLNHNELKYVSAELGLGTFLDELLLEGNPQTMVPASTLFEGTATTTRFLRSKLARGAMSTGTLPSIGSAATFEPVPTPKNIGTPKNDRTDPLEKEIEKLEGQLKQVSLTEMRRKVLTRQLLLAKAKRPKTDWSEQPMW